MLQYSVSPAGQSGRNEAFEDEDSDSGDSLFITQVPVPEAVRPQRRRRLTLRSDATFNEDPVNEIWPVTDDGKSDTDREKRGESYRLPKYSFSFLSEKGQRSSELSSQQNRKLHYALMGGYFKCVRERWESYRSGEDLVESQPTIDMVGVHIAPISEEEDGLEDTDIKVVEKKHFVVPSKAKRSKPWYNPEETASVVRQQTKRPSVAGFESQRRQRKRVDKDSTWKPSLKIALSIESALDRKRLNDGNSSDSVLQEGETGDQCVTSDKTVEAQADPQNAERSLKRAKRQIFNQNEKQPGGNSSAAVCDSSPKKAAKRGEEGSAAVLEPQSDVGHGEHEPESQILVQGDDNTPCSETRVKKKKKKKKKNQQDHEAVEEGRDQSQEEVEGRHAEASVSPGTTEVEEALSASQAVDESDPPESKQKKKKRKKTKSATEDIRQDVGGHTDGKVEEDSVLNPENGGKNKKKKRKRSSDHGDVEGLKTNTLAQHVTDNDKILKKKRKKELNETSDLPQIPTEHLETGDCLENTSESQQTLEFSHVQRKKHKKKKRSASNDNHVGGGSCTDVDFNDATNSSVSTGVSVKKKSISETCIDVSYTPEEDKNADDAQKPAETPEEQDADTVTKKKKKKKKKEKFCTNLTEDTETPSDYSESAQKKGKKKASSFLVGADEEEKAGRTRRENDSRPQSVAARDSYAEKPAVSEGSLTAEAAEITGSLGGLKKKKKKRSAEENVEKETGFEEAKETGQMVLSETGVRKQKKKRKREESELIGSTGRLESAADVEDSQTDEAVMVRKKKKKKKGKEAIPQAATEAPETEKSTPSTCASFSPKKKAKQGRSSKISDESSFCNDQETRETLVQDASLSGNKAFGGNKKKREKAAHNHVLQVNSLINSAEVETPQTKKKERKEPTAECRLGSSLSKTSLAQLETSPSNSIRKNKLMKGKRRLHNPNEDFL